MRRWRSGKGRGRADIVEDGEGAAAMRSPSCQSGEGKAVENNVSRRMVQAAPLRTSWYSPLSQRLRLLPPFRPCPCPSALRLTFIPVRQHLYTPAMCKRKRSSARYKRPLTKR